MPSLRPTGHPQQDDEVVDGHESGPGGVTLWRGLLVGAPYRECEQHIEEDEQTRKRPPPPPLVGRDNGLSHGHPLLSSPRRRDVGTMLPSGSAPRCDASRARRARSGSHPVGKVASYARSDCISTRPERAEDLVDSLAEVLRHRSARPDGVRVDGGALGRDAPLGDPRTGPSPGGQPHRWGRRGGGQLRACLSGHLARPRPRRRGPPRCRWQRASARPKTPGRSTGWCGRCWPSSTTWPPVATCRSSPSCPAGASRFTRVRAVADLFDRYHLHRPEMIRAWADAHRSGAVTVDGSGRAISSHAAWQPRLWRILRDEIGSASPPERMGGTLDLVRTDQLALDAELPSRLVLFGFTSLPGRDFLPLVEAVAIRRDVHLFLLEPHRFDLAALLDQWPRPGGRSTPSAVRGSDRGPGPAAAAAFVGTAAPRVRPAPGRRSRPRHRAPDLGPDRRRARRTLLERLQADIRSDAEAVPGPVGPDDRSLRFHSCFGPMRQVQVARDAILHLLDDPASGLAEEDILVVCPGLEKFAPLVEAVFGPSGGSPDASDSTGAPFLRYRIADRSIRSANPVLGATAALLDLVSGRFEIAQVLDFISLSPVRERFGFDDADLAVLAEWATEARVRWGLDPDHRSGFGVPATVVGNTWQAALDRLLIGSAVADARPRPRHRRDRAARCRQRRRRGPRRVGVHRRPAGDARRVLDRTRSDRRRLGRGPPPHVQRPLRRARSGHVADRGVGAGAARTSSMPPRRPGGVRRWASTYSTSGASSRGGWTTSPGAPTSSAAASRSRRWPRSGGCRSVWCASWAWTRTRWAPSAPDAADLVAADPQIGDPDPAI